MGENARTDEGVEGGGRLLVGPGGAKFLGGCVGEVDGDDVGGLAVEEALFAGGVEDVVGGGDESGKIGGRGVSERPEWEDLWHIEAYPPREECPDRRVVSLVWDMPSAIVIRSPGTNCEAELCRGFEMAGAEVELVHLDGLLREPGILERHELIGFPGGFSYGDDVASGRIFAMKVRTGLYPALREALGRGAMVIGVCNGFQALVQVGLLPGPGVGEAWPEGGPPPQTLALSENQDAKFHDCWVPVEYDAGSVCVWTRGLGGLGESGGATQRDAGILPVAHGEGRLVLKDAGVLAALERGGQVAVRYRDNYNGSAGAVAGVCDGTGRVFGLMPHPERFLDWNRHPWWTRLDASVRKAATPGLRIFQNAVEAVSRAGV